MSNINVSFDLSYREPRIFGFVCIIGLIVDHNLDICWIGFKLYKLKLVRI